MRESDVVKSAGDSSTYATTTGHRKFQYANSFREIYAKLRGQILKILLKDRKTSSYFLILYKLRLVERELFGIICSKVWLKSHAGNDYDEI